MIPEVFIASVPWRRAELEAILRQLAKDPPRHAHVFLDDLAPGQPWPSGPRGLSLRMHQNEGRQGPGPRWYAAAVAPDDTLAIVIDDDFALPDDYVSRCLSAWERLQAPFSWCGGDERGKYHPATMVTTQDVRLGCLGAGLACVPSKYLRRLTQDPYAAEYLGYLGHDEAFVSWWLSSRHLELWRPRGPSGVTSTKAQYDPRSQFKSAGDRLIPLHNRLVERGWKMPVLKTRAVAPQLGRR